MICMPFDMIPPRVIVYDGVQLYSFKYNELQSHTLFLFIFSHIHRAEGNTVVYLTVTLTLIILEKPGDTQSPGLFYFAPPFAIQIKIPINTANAAMTAIKINDLRGPLGERYTFAPGFGAAAVTVLASCCCF